MGSIGWGTRPKNFHPPTGEWFEPNSTGLLGSLRQRMTRHFYTPEVDEVLESFTAWFTSGVESNWPLEMAVYEITGGVDSASLIYNTTILPELSDYINGTVQAVPLNERPTLLAGHTYGLGLKVASGSWHGYGFYTESGYWEANAVGSDSWPDPSVWSGGAGLYEFCGLANTQPKRALRVDVKKYTEV